MNTNIKKKGRSAIAIILSLAMILTTATFPVSVAKADTPQVMPVVVDLTPSQPTGGEGLQHYNLPSGYNFVYIKQGDDSHVLWTAENFEWIWGNTIDIGEQIENTEEKDGPEWASFKEFLGSQLNFASDLKKETSIDYIYGFENSPFVFGNYSYEFTLDETDGHISFLYMGDKVSHFYAGMYRVPNDTVSLAFTKELTGMDLESDMFDFTLSEATIVDDLWVEGDVLQTVSNTDSMNDNVVFNDLVFDEEGTFYFIIKELAVDPIDGVTYDMHVVKLTVTVEEIGEGVFDAVAVFDGAMVFTNTYEEEEYGSIPVTKTVEIPDGATFNVPYTFYVALFDEEGVMYDEYEPLELTVTSGTELTASGTFTGLDLEQDYYVYEVYMVEDEFVKIETNPIDDTVISPEGIPWKTIEYANNEDIAFGDDNIAATVTVNNVYSSEENPYDPSVKVIKTVTVNNKPTASNLTFYAGLFEDKELTKLIAFKPLEMKGTPTAEAAFAFYGDGVTPLKAGTTYYVAETNAQGVPLAGTAKELGFEITINSVSGNNAAVELIEEEAIVNIVNNFTKEEFPLTGDNSNMNLWLFLAMLGVAGAIAPFAFRKKEVAND